MWKFIFRFLLRPYIYNKKVQKIQKKCRKMKKDDFSCLEDSKIYIYKTKIAHFKGSEQFLYIPYLLRRPLNEQITC